MTLTDATDIAQIVQAVVAVLAAGGGGILLVQYIKRMRPVWKRFAENVGRQVAVISVEDQSMEHEAELLKRVGFFKVKEFDADVRSLDLIAGSGLIVVGYSPDSKVYDTTLRYAKDHGLPIIVFAGMHELEPEKRKELFAYSFSSLCQSELRLVSDVFAAISTFPRAGVQ